MFLAHMVVICRAVSLAEFAQVCRKHRESEEEQERMHWERMRLLAAITIQPQCKKKITPEKLLPLPWDRDAQKNNPPKRRVDSTRERMMEVWMRSITSDQDDDRKNPRDN